MNNNQLFLSQIPSLDAQELNYLLAFTKDLPQDKLQTFIAMYNSRRKKPDVILITCLLGFVGFAGVHRFLINQWGMGILYFLTGGLCLIGTVVDIINHKQLAFDNNQTAAVETMTMVGGV